MSRVDLEGSVSGSALENKLWVLPGAARAAVTAPGAKGLNSLKSWGVGSTEDMFIGFY